MKRSVYLQTLVLCFLNAVNLRAQSVPTNPTFLVIDARANDAKLAKYYSAVAQAYQFADWYDYKTSGSDTILTLIAANYNMTSLNLGRFPETCDVVTQMILFKNPSEHDPTAPIVSRSIRLPRLPKLPNPDARPDLVQVQSINGGAYYVEKLAALNEPAKIGNVRHENLPLEEAGSIALLDTRNLRDAIDYQGTLKLQLYAGPSARLKLYPLESTPNPRPPSFSQSAVVQLPSAPDFVKARVQNISPSLAGKLYILDFDVDSNCSHGKKVSEVVTQTLESFGGKNLSDHIVLIELNYFAHPASARSKLSFIVENVTDNDVSCLYKRYFSESFGRVLTSCDDSLPEVAPQATSPDVFYVPGFYLWLLFEYLLDPISEASVVSNSYYTVSNGFDVATSERPNHWPALVAAAFNPGIPPPFATSLQYEQPTKKFWTSRTEFGTFLVGAVLKDGSSYGMTSDESHEYPSGVTAFALGEGYGNTEDEATKTCIRPDNKGTSFATPVISLELFLARAIWRSEDKLNKQNQESPDWKHAHEPVSVMEAKRRLILSSTVSPDLVDKAGAAGVPDFERLVAPATNEDVLVSANKEVKVGMVERAIVVLKGRKREYGDKVGGIQVSGGRVFAYDEDLMAWQEGEARDFYVKIQDRPEINSVSEFEKSYISIVRFK